MEGRRNKSDVFHGVSAPDVEKDGEEEVSMMGKMSKRRLSSFLQIIKEFRDSVYRSSGEGDGPSSVFYVPNEDEDDGDDDNIAAVVRGGCDGGISRGLLRTESSSSLKVGAHAYENIGTSSGSEFGNNESLEKPRQKSGRNGDGGGRNKIGFGSVGNLGETGDHHGDATSHASGTGASKVKSTKSNGSRRCSASDQNLNDGFKDNDEYGEDCGNSRGMVMGNELENENEFGPQSLFITANGSCRSGGRNLKNESGRRNHLDRRIIASSSSSTKMGIISGQETNGGTAPTSTNNGGWQLDGNCTVGNSNSITTASATTVNMDNSSSNRASYASNTSRASNISSESFKDIFARNLKRPFKSSETNKTKVIRNEHFFATNSLNVGVCIVALLLMRGLIISIFVQFPCSMLCYCCCLFTIFYIYSNHATICPLMSCQACYYSIFST